MDKNNRQHLLHRYKPEVALFCIALMLVGLLCSRSIGSISIALFSLNAFRGVNINEWVKQKWWAFGLAWMLLFGITIFWSVDLGEWNAHEQVKMPFVLLPLAFGLLPPFNQKHQYWFTIILYGLLFLGCCWSLWHFAMDAQHYIKGYGYSNLIPTPAYGDHISFSTAIAAAIIWGFYQWPQWKGGWRILGSVAVAFFVIYLHILAAKTGLASLYLFLAAYLGYLIFSRQWKLGIGLVISFVLLIFIALKTVPTFQRRIGYMQWVAGQYAIGDRDSRYGDVSRLISYDVALRIIAKHPVAGVGVGDMMNEMNRGYDKWYPRVLEQDRLIPHNQFLTIALGAGIPALILFTLWILAPLRWLKRNRSSAFFLFMWLALLVPLMIDPFLEVQWGVLVYLLPLLWCRKTLLQD